MYYFFSLDIASLAHFTSQWLTPHRCDRVPDKTEMGLHAQQTRVINPMLFICWVSVEDGGPTLKQHWVDASCLVRVYGIILWNALSSTETVLYGNSVKIKLCITPPPYLISENIGGQGYWVSQNFQCRNCSRISICSMALGHINYACATY